LRRYEVGHFGRPGHPDVKLVQRKRIRRLRQDADDRVWRPIEVEWLPEDRRIAVETLPPHAVADQHDRFTAGTVFGR
jgi:hypothetical protein